MAPQELLRAYIRQRMKDGQLWKLHLINLVLERETKGIDASSAADTLTKRGIAPEQDRASLVQRCGNCMGHLVSHVGVIRRRKTTDNRPANYYPNPRYLADTEVELARAGIRRLKNHKNNGNVRVVYMSEESLIECLRRNRDEIKANAPGPGASFDQIRGYMAAQLELCTGDTESVSDAISKVKAEHPEWYPPIETPASCATCKDEVALSTVIDICSQSANMPEGINCEDIYNRYKSGEITSEQGIQTFREGFSGAPEEALIDEVERLSKAPQEEW